MSSSATASAAFDLKSTAWTLTAVRLHSAQTETLAAALQARFADTPGLFDGDAVVLDFSPLRDGDSLPDLAALLPLLRRHGMVPVAVQGGNAGQMAAGRAAGPVRRDMPLPEFAWRTRSPQEFHAEHIARHGNSHVRGFHKEDAALEYLLSGR